MQKTDTVLPAEISSIVKEAKNFIDNDLKHNTNNPWFNMFLTGFDSKRLNTLYVDKKLKYHGLIQAFSRTNRVVNAAKPHGNVVCFRNLKEQTDEAIALFANIETKETVLMGSYDDYVKQFNDAVGKLRQIMPDANVVLED